QTFGHLEITEVAVKGYKLHIRGDTDLPPGSKLHLDARLPWLNTTPGNKKTFKLRVNSNHFFAMIDLPKGKTFKGMSVLLRVIFRPSEQDGPIKVKVGAKGEKIKGEKASLEKNEFILSDTKDITL
ncbi:MAG TPA: hypothetical protein DIC53_06405, partial [Synergistaceae bacterium]|nr:hypothetical protein [Synergistaceae bacterium]